MTERRESHAPQMEGDQQQHRVRKRLVNLFTWTLVPPFNVAAVARLRFTVIVVCKRRSDHLQLPRCCFRATGLFMSHPVKADPDSVTSTAMIMAAPAGLWPR